MKTKKQTTPKIIAAACLAQLMCVSVVLSHIHAKDTVPLLSHPASATRMASRDITAKALGDLHHHIDKAGVKSPHSDASTATRNRQLNPMSAEDMAEDASLVVRIQHLLLRFRIISTLIYSYA